MKRFSENSVISIKNKSFSVTAQIVAPEAPLEGVVVAQGGAFGGWAFYAKQGTLRFVYNVLGLREFVTVQTGWSRRARTSCVWSSPTTAAVSAREAMWPSSSTGNRPVRGGSS